MNIQKQVRQDILQMKEFFPKLLLLNNNMKAPSFGGEIDICDTAGEYWDTFRIKILAPDNYPNGAPLMEELEGRIDRIADRHINSDGTCCVAIHHVLFNHASKGLTITDYTRQYAYPYLANHLYYEKEGHYADKEYKHGFEGVKQFYAESLNLKDSIQAVKILEALISGNLPARNKPCLCGNNKIQVLSSSSCKISNECWN